VVARPPLLLADEPTGNLDPDLSREIFELFERFHHVGVTLMIATHDLALIRVMRHRTFTLSDGRLVDDSGGR
jgi:cell division transport system ATP-binding protein